MCSACAGDYENPQMTAPAPDADLAENHEYYPAQQQGDREMPTRKARVQEKTDRAGSTPFGTVAARGGESTVDAGRAQTGRRTTQAEGGKFEVETRCIERAKMRHRKRGRR